MNLSDTSSVLTLLLGAITACTWIWKQLAWFRKRHSEAQELAGEGSRLAQLLLSHATNPTKRSDIHFFMTLRAVESAARQTQATIYSMAMGIVTGVLFFFWALLGKLFEIDYTHLLVIFTFIIFASLVVSLFMSLWFSFNLRKMENGWQAGAMKAIEKKIEQHMPEA